MPYAPTVNDNSGQILAGGIGNTVAQFAQDMDLMRQNEQKRRVAAGQIAGILQANPQLAQGVDQSKLAKMSTGKATLNDTMELLGTLSAADGQIKEQQKMQLQQAQVQSLLQNSATAQMKAVQAARQSQLNSAITELGARIAMGHEVDPQTVPPELMAAATAKAAELTKKATQQVRSTDEKGNPVYRTKNLLTGKEDVSVIRDPSTNINLGNNQNEMINKAMMQARENAGTAVNTIDSLSRAKEILAKDTAITGTGADGKLALAKIGALFGIEGNGVQDTEVLRASLAPQVLTMVKQLGSGTGISNADREFAEKAAGGSIALDGATIKRLVDIGEKAARRTVEDYNSQLNKLYPEDEKDANKQQMRKFLELTPGQTRIYSAPEAAPVPQAPGAPKIRTYNPKTGKIE